jgi:hypothetical protein
MKRITALLLQLPRPATAATTIALSAIAVAPSVLAGQPALTIYNQNFAVVRDTVPIDLKQGVNNVRFTETTAHLEPASVILRDPSGKTNLQILEQNYRNDPVSQERLRAAQPGRDAALRSKLRHGPIGDGLSKRWNVATDHRGGWQTALYSSWSAAFSAAQRRHHSKTDHRMAIAGR